MSRSCSGAEKYSTGGYDINLPFHLISRSFLAAREKICMEFETPIYKKLDWFAKIFSPIDFWRRDFVGIGGQYQGSVVMGQWPGVSGHGLV